MGVMSSSIDDVRVGGMTKGTGGRSGVRNSSYTTDRRNPNAPVIDSSENLFRLKRLYYT